MRRRFIFILIGLAVLIVPAVIAAYVINHNPRLSNAVLKLGNINSARNANLTNTAGNANLATNTSASADQTAILYVSRNFAEMYGSGSNQNNGSNIVAAEKWGTKNFVDFLNRQIQQQASQPATPYHAFITKVLVMNFTKLTAATASVTVSTQRQETIDRTTKVYYQDLLLDFVKTGQDWQVNAASWKAL